MTIATKCLQLKLANSSSARYNIKHHNRRLMKRCLYCGAEYPDDAIICAVDQTPLGRTPDLSPHVFRSWPHVLFAVCCGLGMTFLSIWLLRLIPLGSHSFIREVVERSMIVPIILASWIDSVHGLRFSVWCPIFIFIQWSVVGIGLFSFVRKSRHHNDVA